MKDDYKQHSPEVADGKDGFIAFSKEFFKQKPHAEIIPAWKTGITYVYFSVA